MAVCLMLEASGMYGDGPQVHIGFLPFYHIFGLNNLLFHSTQKGVPVVVMERFHPDQCLALIERYKVTFALVVPPIIISLLNHPGTCRN
jgi:4-coumarate--CoA ligase